jgi:predicted ATPase
MNDSAAEHGTPDRAGVPFISRVRLKNYKSIAECDVRLGPLTILVGPNGSGKSNFLDALAFLARAVQTTPTEAIEERGGMGEILRRVPDDAQELRIEVEAKTTHQGTLTYVMDIDRTGEISREGYIPASPDEGGTFTAERGRILSGDRGLQKIDIGPKRLFLPIARQFGSLAEQLGAMRFYNLEPETLRKPHSSPHLEPVLGRSGGDIGDVLAELAAGRPETLARIDAYMRAIVPNADGVESVVVGDYATIALRASSGGPGRNVRFGSRSMSDGTIRAAGVLAALFQPEVMDGDIGLIGIEEPEAGLHPSAAGVLFDALTEASEHVQVITATQSADLLDREDLDASLVRAVTMKDGLTIIGEVDDASREIAEKKLHTLGELMRGDQIVPKLFGDTS